MVKNQDWKSKEPNYLRQKKNSRMKKVIAALVLLMTFGASCKKEGCTNSLALNYDADAKKDDGSCKCIAGPGGNVNFAFAALHHGDTIYSTDNYRDTAFMKYGATEFPGTLASNYDTFFVGKTTGHTDHIHVAGFNCGKYYVWMTGWDPAINERVTGGIPLTIEQNEGSVDVSVPVTEH